MIFRPIKFGIVILFFCLCACDQHAKTVIPPLAQKGVLDLTNWDFERDGPVNLTGGTNF